MKFHNVTLVSLPMRNANAKFDILGENFLRGSHFYTKTHLKNREKQPTKQETKQHQVDVHGISSVSCFFSSTFVANCTQRFAISSSSLHWLVKVFT